MTLTLDAPPQSPSDRVAPPRLEWGVALRALQKLLANKADTSPLNQLPTSSHNLLVSGRSARPSLPLSRVWNR